MLAKHSHTRFVCFANTNEMQRIMVAVTDADGNIVAEATYNTNLDYWDGQNYSCGSRGRHKGLAQLGDGRFVLVHGTQWQGEKTTAELITSARAVQEILRSGNTDLFDEYPELEEARGAMPTDKGEGKTRTFAVRINAHAPADEVDAKVIELRRRIAEFVK